ncbi:hypothetical protein PR048_004766 [Dryococelus australis]|uniref:Uncharacterized protein n=1 Tax=Dryococelus australis TaxID=614101 RepID=A0ABQ9I6A4_9NEOP|nr:hypothetical protein PR048_004766 [Dryococelus australis]
MSSASGRGDQNHSTEMKTLAHSMTSLWRVATVVAAPDCRTATYCWFTVKSGLRITRSPTLGRPIVRFPTAPFQDDTSQVGERAHVHFRAKKQQYAEIQTLGVPRMVYMLGVVNLMASVRVSYDSSAVLVLKASEAEGASRTLEGLGRVLRRTVAVVVCVSTNSTTSATKPLAFLTGVSPHTPQAGGSYVSLVLRLFSTVTPRVRVGQRLCCHLSGSIVAGLFGSYAGSIRHSLREKLLHASWLLSAGPSVSDVSREAMQAWPRRWPHVVQPSSRARSTHVTEANRHLRPVHHFSDNCKMTAFAICHSTMQPVLYTSASLATELAKKTENSVRNVRMLALEETVLEAVSNAPSTIIREIGAFSISICCCPITYNVYYICPHVLNPDNFRFACGFCNNYKTLPALLEGVPLVVSRDIWFHHNVSPAHSSATAKAHMNVAFDTTCIDYHSSIEGPRHSPKLSPLDLFVWGHLKSLVYKTPVTQLDNLSSRIMHACNLIQNTPGMLGKMGQSLLLHWQLYANIYGCNLEQLLEHILSNKHNNRMDNSCKTRKDSAPQLQNQLRTLQGIRLRESVYESQSAGVLRRRSSSRRSQSVEVCRLESVCTSQSVGWSQ